MQLACVLDDDHPVGGLGDLGQEGVGQCRLACRGSSGDEDVGAGGDSLAKDDRLIGSHDVGGHIIVEAEDGDGRLTDGEGGSGDDRWQEAFEALAAVRQFGGDARAAWMHLGADMVGHEPDDTFAVSGGETLPRVGETLRQTIHPKATIGVQHHLDDGGVFEEPRDRGTKRGAQHARAANKCLRFEVCGGHLSPAS